MKEKATTLAANHVSKTFLAVAFSMAVALSASAQDTWTGNDDANSTNWTDGGNWQSGNAPLPYDSLVFNGGNVANSNGFPNGTAFDGITFEGSAFNLTGNSILLSGSLVANMTGVLNNSGTGQTVGLNLTLDGGFYAFSDFSGSGLNLNGTLSPGNGGVAYFYSVNSSSLMLDNTTGLIQGLEGQGLMYNGTVPVNPTAYTPVGLATISGGLIQAYSGYTQIAGGATSGAAVAIGSGNNILLTSSGASGFYSASANTVNTISAAQAGNSGGTATTTLTVASGNVLTLGSQGGIYLINNNDSGSKSCLLVTGGNITAGPTNVGGTIVLATDGTTSGNQMTVASAIINNGTGPVSVICTGPGSINPSGVSTYTGGLYIAQGQFQGNTTSVGWGPVYVSSNATAFLNGSGTYSNNFYISAGNGTVLETGSSANPGAVLLSSGGNDTFTGTLNLMGPSIPDASVGSVAGCRLTGDDVSATYFLNGPITGTGTLDLNSSPHGTAFTIQNSSTTNNSWTGGLIIEETQATPTSTARTIQVNLGAAGHTQIPHGVGYGDVSLYSAANGGSLITGSTVTLNLLGNSATINGLNGAYASGGQAANLIVENSVSNATLTVGDGNASGSYAGLLKQTGGVMNLAKIGTGTETLSGTINYTGSTAVNGGTLALANPATIANTTPISVATGATFDASGISGITIASAQTLLGHGTVGGNTVVNGTIEAFQGSIGTLTNNGNLTLDSGATYIWHIDDAMGAAGADSGWSMLSVENGSLNISATTGSPATINVTSLTTGDVAGNANNFSSGASYSWPIAYAANGISGFSSTAQFTIITSAFANDANSSSQWSVSVDNTGHYLMLNYSGFQVITSPVSPATLTVNQGQTATFAVTANSLGSGTTFIWYQNGTQLSNGGQSAGGSSGNVTINTVGNMSTLMIAGVDSAQEAMDAGTISVTVNTTYNGNPLMANSSATLNVVDAPYNLSLAQSGAQPNGNFGAYMAGGVAYLAATASGTQPFTYIWSLNGSVINGATSSTLPVDISSASAGTYTVVVSNSAGMVTSSSTVMGPVTVVPNQMIFEPFDSYSTGGTFVQGSALDTFSSAKGITNLFNQLTGEPVYWTVEGSTGNTEVLPNGLGAGAENQFGGEYPWPGLAGNSFNEFYWTTTTVNNHLLITHNGNTVFAPGGANTNIYFSFLMSVVSLGSGSFDGTQSVFGGFCTSAGPSACGLEFWTEDLSGAGNQMLVGVGKGNGTTVNNPTSGVNINPPNVLWSPMNSSPLGNNTWSQQTILVVGCYTVVDGPGGMNDTVSLWINPTSSSFYAATPPPPFLGPTSFGGTVSNSVPQDFVLLNDYPPASHRITDLRIGTTWASVTPPSAPLLTLANQILTNPASSTVVFASQNAGNPVSGNYQWTFNGGSQLSDNGHYTGSQTSALTITGATAADVGTYTVSANNSDPAPTDGGVTLTGSASALLTANLPPLYITSSPPNVVLAWPTNWPVKLQVTASLTPPITWASVAGGQSSFIDWPAGSTALSGFPSSLTISGTNYTTTVGAGSTNNLYFRLAPSP